MNAHAGRTGERGNWIRFESDCRDVAIVSLCFHAKPCPFFEGAIMREAFTTGTPGPSPSRDCQHSGVRSPEEISDEDIPPG